MRVARVATGIAFLLLAGGCSPELPPAADRSVILVTLDTTRADHLGAYGATAVPTPNLDRLAREGVLFEQAISQVPLTLPAHSSLMTGRYPASLGVHHNGIYRLPPAAVTLAEQLGEAGWDTAGFVAAYVLNRGFGIDQGFATFNDVPVNRYERGQDQLFLAQRSADEVNEQVFRWLDERDGGKFFLWVHYYDPHDPYEPPERPGRNLVGEGYDREISYVDACLGDLMERLERAGVLPSAVVIVAGDHGESLGEHGEETHGLFLYEGAVRVPLLIRAPGLLPAGQRVGGPAQLVDVAPTVLELLGVAPLGEAQGRSLLPRVVGEGGDEAEPLAFAETLMPRIEFGWSELYMVHDGRYKYIRAPEPELYDLEEDPGENVNLIGDEPRLALEMASLLDAWIGGATVQGAEAAASRSLTSEEEERLRSLGYLGGGVFRDQAGDDAGRPDPKHMIAEVRALDAARDRLTEGDAAGALAGVREILAANPDNHQARTTEILALIELRDFVEAERVALEALDEARREDDGGVLERKARGLLASVYSLAGNTRLAERQYRELLELDPGNPAVKVDLARLLLGVGRDRESRAQVQEVLAAHPRDGMALALLFRLQLSAGERQEALATAEKLSHERAGDADTLVQAAQVLMEAGRPAAAVPCLETAIEQVDGLPAEWLGRLGLARMESGDVDGAAEAFAAVARLRPADPRAPYYLGNIALMREDEDGARRYFDEAQRIDPGFVAPQLSLARWLAARSRTAEALASLEAAAARRPDDPAVRAELDALRRELGDAP